MIISSLRRKSLLLLLVAVLLTPWASAASLQSMSPRPPQTADSGVPEFFSHIWSLFRVVGSKAGCRIDPNGCANQPAQDDPSLQPKEGCRIDPNGAKASAQNPSSQTKAGCRIDPDGRCL